MNKFFISSLFKYLKEFGDLVSLYFIRISSSKERDETIKVGYFIVFNVIGITWFDSPTLKSTYICCSTADFI